MAVVSLRCASEDLRWSRIDSEKRSDAGLVFGGTREVPLVRLDVEVETTINQPLITVANYVCELATAISWISNIRSAEPHQPAPIRVGSKITFSTKSLGRVRTCTYQVVEFATHYRLVMRGVDSEQPVETTFLFEELPIRATRVRVRHRGGAPGAFRAGVGSSERGVEKTMVASLARLKEVLELPEGGS